MDGKYAQRVLHCGIFQGACLGVPGEPNEGGHPRITFPTTPCLTSGRAALGGVCTG